MAFGSATNGPLQQRHLFQHRRLGADAEGLDQRIDDAVRAPRLDQQDRIVARLGPDHLRLGRVACQQHVGQRADQRYHADLGLVQVLLGARGEAAAGHEAERMPDGRG